MAIKPADQKRSAQFKAGEAAFKSIGCAVCHMPKLGEVDGIYSDLLLHDMGPQLADADAYTVFAGDQLEARIWRSRVAPSYQKPSIISRMANAAALGNARFAPYMHDGRAATISQAITLHAGEGATAARRQSYLSDGSNKSRRF